MTFPPHPGSHPNPSTNGPLRTGPAPHRQPGAPYAGYVGYPAGPQGYVPPPKKSKTGLVIIVIVVLLGVGVFGFLGAQALADRDSAFSGDSDPAAAGSGETFAPPGKPYTVEIPTGLVKVGNREDDSIPSETDLSLELEGKVGSGGLIKTGTLSGPAADGSYQEVGEEAARKYAGQYEGHPDLWGTGAKVDKETTTVGGRNSIRISARFSPSAKPDPSTFFRIYFVEPPSGPTILITCDWNKADTAEIGSACDILVALFKVKSA